MRSTLALGIVPPSTTLGQLHAMARSLGFIPSKSRLRRTALGWHVTFAE